MGALLAEKAGWWQLDTLLQALAHQASAGTRPELFALMEVQRVIVVVYQLSHHCISVSRGLDASVVA